MRAPKALQPRSAALAQEYLCHLHAGAVEYLDGVLVSTEEAPLLLRLVVGAQI